MSFLGSIDAEKDATLLIVVCKPEEMVFATPRALNLFRTTVTLVSSSDKSNLL